MSDRDALQKRIKLVLGEVVSDEAFEMIRAQALDECLDIATTYGHPNVIATVIKQLKEQP